MKFVRVPAYPILLLLALWIPKMVQARFGTGLVLYSPVSGLHADLPYLWCTWLVSLALIVLVHGWFLRGAKKYLIVRTSAAVLVALILQAIVAPNVRALNNDTLTIDAAAMFCTGFITAFLILCWRSICKDRISRIDQKDDRSP